MSSNKHRPPKNEKEKMMKNLVVQLSENRTRARIDLLGEQWFQGRTGNVMRENIPYIPFESSGSKKKSAFSSGQKVTQEDLLPKTLN